MSRSRLVTAVVCAGALALGAGCGGADKEDYEQGVEEALTPIQEEGPPIVQELQQAQNPAEGVDPLSRFEELQQGALDDLEGLDPPDEVSDLHDQLVGAQSDFTEATGAAVTAAENEDQAGLQEFQSAGQEYQQELTRIEQEFGDKDYQFDAAQ